MPGHAIHFLGGEPTLHAGIDDFLNKVMARGYPVRVFSNLSTRLDPGWLQDMHNRGVEWIVNAEASNKDTPRGLYRQFLRNLEKLGPAASLCYNIVRPGQNIAGILDLIQEYGCRREIKIGITLPTMTGANDHLLGHDFAAVGRQVAEFIVQARKEGCRIGFECGLPYCLFRPAERLLLEEGQISHCGSRLDVLPDGSVINCLPLSGLARVPFTRFAHYGMALAWFRLALAPYRGLGSLDRCVGCADLEAGRCSYCVAPLFSTLNRVVLPPLPDTADAGV